MFVDRIPYDWVFPKVYGVIHHGGSGTTHTALKYGCANLILPHIMDQYVWNSRIAELNAGPLGMDISKISSSKLSDKVADLWNNKSYKKNAELLGTQIQEEDLEDDLVKFILREE